MDDKWLKRFIAFQAVAYVVFLTVLIVLMIIGTTALIKYLTG